MGRGTLGDVRRLEVRMRARQPDVQGLVDRDGVKIGYEVFGSGEPTVMLMPPWAIINSLHWKAQVPMMARHSG